MNGDLVVAPLVALACVPVVWGIAWFVTSRWPWT